MKLSTYLVTLCALLFYVSVSAQLQNLNGKVAATDDVEGIHILNKTALKYTVTNTDGSFSILAKANDTLAITSLKYETKQLRVTTAMLNTNNITVYLKENVNQLDEIIIGKILTGNLGSDIGNLDIKTPINFYDLGIPGYVGKHKTLSERKLVEATTGGGIIPLFPIINAITGRTKMLKKNIQLDKNRNCMEAFKKDYQAMLFDTNDFTEQFQNHFFSFIMDSEMFEEVCTSSNALNKVAFLQNELKAFKKLKAPHAEKN